MPFSTLLKKGYVFRVFPSREESVIKERSLAKEGTSNSMEGDAG